MNDGTFESVEDWFGAFGKEKCPDIHPCSVVLSIQYTSMLYTASVRYSTDFNRMNEFKMLVPLWAIKEKVLEVVENPQKSGFLYK